VVKINFQGCKKKQFFHGGKNQFSTVMKINFHGGKNQFPRRVTLLLI